MSLSLSSLQSCVSKNLESVKLMGDLEEILSEDEYLDSNGDLSEDMVVHWKRERERKKRSGESPPPSRFESYGPLLFFSDTCESPIPLFMLLIFYCSFRCLSPQMRKERKEIMRREKRKEPFFRLFFFPRNRHPDRDSVRKIRVSYKWL
jgi:hypothetical protein